MKNTIPNRSLVDDTRAPAVRSCAAVSGALAALLVLLLLALPGTAQAAITVGSSAGPSSVGYRGINSANTIILNPALSFTPGVNGMLIVTVSGEYEPTSITVTYGGVGMTPGPSVTQGTGGSAGYAGLFYLLSPALSGSALVVTANGNGTRYGVNAVYATGVNQGVPEASQTLGSVALTNDTAAITPTAGALVVTAYGSSASGSAVGASFKNLIYTNSPSGSLSGQTTPAQPTPTAGSQSAMSYKVVADASPVKGHYETVLASATDGKAVIIASFAPGGATVFDHIAVTASSPQTAGAAFDVTITGQDSGNAPVNDSITTVSVSSSSSFMEFDWNSDGTYGDNSGTLVSGTKTIKARNKKAETATIAAGGGGAITPTPPSVTTAAGTFTKLQILAPGETAAPGTATGKTGTPSIRTIGVAFNATVNGVDTNWNVVNTVTDTVGITSTDGAATLPANAALVAGTGTFSVTLNTFGSATVTATDVTDGSKTANTTPSITVQGLPVVWKGDGSLNQWDTSTLNWTNLSGTVTNFASGGLATFDNTGSGTPAVDIVGTVTPFSITVTNTTVNYTFGSTTGGSIGGITGLAKSGTGKLTLSTSNTFTGTTTIAVGTGLPLGGTLTLNHNLALQNSPITPGGTNVMTLGAGVTTPVFGGLSGANETSLTNYITVGYANVTAVTLNVGAGVSVSSGMIVADGVAGTKLIKTGPGTQTLTGANNFTGAAEVREGTLVVGSTSGGRFPSTMPVILGNGTTSGVFQLGSASGANNQTLSSLTTSGSGTANAVVGGFSSVSALTLNLASDTTYAGFLGGAGANQNNLSLTKSGTGTLTLSSANTYNGGTTVNGGAVRAANNSAFGTNTITLNATDAALELGNGINISAPLNIASPGSRKLIQQQPGATTGEYSGPITIVETGAGNFIVTNGVGQTLTVSGAVGGAQTGVTKVGAGTAIFSGANTSTGDITVSAGTLALSGGATVATAPNIILASDTGFDVSAPATALSLGASQVLKASATGGNATATITVATGKDLTLGGTGTGLAFTAFGGGATAPLTVAGTGGSLALNSRPVTVNTTAALAAGTYKLIAKSGSAVVSGTPGALNVNGSGVVSGATPTLQVVSGELYLYVPGISISGSLAALTTTYGAASAASSVAISGTGLTGDITATRPDSNFEVSSDNLTWGNTATFTTSGGSASGTLYVRLATNAPVVGTYNSQNTVLSSTGASNVNAPTAASGNAVNPAPASVTADAKSKAYGDVNPALTATEAGTVNGDLLNYTLATDAAQFSSVGVSNITVTLGSNPNYNVSAMNSTLTIGARAASVTADAQSKAYGDVNPALTATEAGTVNGDLLSYTLATDAAQFSSVGVSNITVTLGSNPNYSVSATNSTLTIGTRAASVTADAQSKAYGDVNPALTATEAGTVNGDLLSYTLATDATQFSSVGVSNITVTLGSNPNYSVSATNSTLTIGTRAASVTADAKSKAYGDVNPALTATEAGTVNGDLLSYTLATDATQFSSVGVSNITVTLGSNPNYSVSATNSTLTIGTRAASVTADAQSKAYGDVNPALTATEAGTVNGDLLSYTLATDAAQFSSVGVSNITVTLGSNPNYSVSATNSTLTIGTRAASVTANDASKNYGQTVTFAGTEFTTSGLVGGDSVTSVTLTSSGATNTASIGTYPIVAGAAVGIGLGNYTLSYTNGTLTVNPGTPVTVNSPVVLNDRNIQLTFTGGDAGVSYQIQASTNLSSPTWSTLATNVADNLGLPSFTDLNATNYPIRFYRTVTP